MSQPIDEQIRRAFDSLAERLRVSMVEQVGVTAGQLAASVDSAREAAVEAASRDAAAVARREVTERLTDSFARREEEVREAARAEWFEAGLRQARAEALAIQDARDARAQAEAEAAAKSLADARAEVVTAQAAVARATAEATAASAAILASAVTDRRASLERLLQSVRDLDAASSLSQALDALAGAAKSEADRTAVFLVRGETLRAWSHAGYDALDEAPGFELPLTQAGVAAEAIRVGTVRTAARGTEGRPTFVAAHEGGTFVAVPLMMNGEAIAVLCGEQPTATDDGESLASTFEVLARHAARVLESLTALRLAQLGSQPPAKAAASPPQ